MKLSSTIKIIFLLPWICVAMHSRGEALSNTVSGGLTAANAEYKSENYQAALDGYLAVLAKEPDNPHAFYNAGNAYFRLNKPGLAVLFYAKAFRLEPRDTDIRTNFDFALKRTGQALIPDGVPKALHYLYYLLSDGELKAGAIVFWWLALVLGSVYALKPVLRTKIDGPLAVSALICLGLAVWLALRASSTLYDAAVVTAEGSAPLLSGPGDSFKNYATLPEGRIVKIIDDSDNAYYEIGIPREGVKGWLKKEAADRI